MISKMKKIVDGVTADKQSVSLLHQQARGICVSLFFPILRYFQETR